MISASLSNRAYRGCRLCRLSPCGVATGRLSYADYLSQSFRSSAKKSTTVLAVSQNRRTPNAQNIFEWSWLSGAHWPLWRQQWVHGTSDQWRQQWLVVLWPLLTSQWSQGPHTTADFTLVNTLPPVTNVTSALGARSSVTNMTSSVGAWGPWPMWRQQ